jgi:hypothetical protein
VGQELSLEAVVAVLHPAGERFEVRLLHCGAEGTVAGIFDDPTQVARAVAPYDGVAEGCYITLNPLTEAVKITNRLTPNVTTATPDAQVERRRWLLLDFDPDRCDPLTGAILYQTAEDGRPILTRDGKPKKLKCPATDAELAKALARRDEAEAFFAGRSWPRPLKGMSANGGHLLYALDLPNDDEAADLVAGVLRAAAKHFTGEGIDLDLTVFNASRITKLYGTLAKKGKATADRPYRRAYLEAPDGSVAVVAADLLQVFAEEAGWKPRAQAVETSAGAPITGATVTPGGPGRYDLDRLKELADIVTVADALGLKPKKAGRKNFVAFCPAHPDAPGPGKRPNLSLNADKGAICFVCGFKAGAVDLVMKVKNCDAGEAIRWLAGLVNLAPERPSGNGAHAGAQARLGYGQKGKTGATYPKRGAPLPDPATLGPTPPAVCTQTLAPAGEVAPKVFTLVWPPDTKPATVGGKWKRLADGSVEATYTRDELVVALWVMGKATDEAELDRILGAPLTPQGERPTLRVEVYRAFLSHCRPILAGDDHPPAGAVWLRDHKGLTLATQEAVGLHWLDDWAKADHALKATFGVEVLQGLGLLTDKGKLHFDRHRLIFPFWVKTPAGDLAPVYAQGRNVTATDKRYRFDNVSGAVPCPYNVEAVRAARATGRPVFICEGATDTLSLTQSGRLACGIVGTQGFKPDWTKSFTGLDVYLAFDPDDAGQTAARAVADVFVGAGLPSPKVVKLPPGQDVTDFFTGKRSKETSANTPLAETSQSEGRTNA